MKIGIFGAGALGSLLGAYLSADNEVILYGRENHIQAINKSGLQVLGVAGEKTYQLCGATDLMDQNFDLGIIAVKSYDTENILQELKKQKVRMEMVASIQNGLKESPLYEKFGLEKTLGCVVNEAARLIKPGQICYTNQGSSYFGISASNEPLTTTNSKLKMSESLVETLQSQGLKAEVSRDMDTLIWYKFLSSSTMAVSGALDLNVAEKYLNHHACKLYLQAIDEIVRVALAENIPFSNHILLNNMFLVNVQERQEIAEKKREYYSKLVFKRELHVPSLVQDLRRGKTETEADTIIGKMLQLGQKHNLEMPVLKVCYSMIKAKEIRNSQVIAPNINHSS